MVVNFEFAAAFLATIMSAFGRYVNRQGESRWRWLSRNPQQTTPQARPRYHAYRAPLLHSRPQCASAFETTDVP
jgi:hypothetical protein